jgi:CheY-like chemotaxis protein
MARILVIDDNPDVRTLVSDILGKDGHEVLEAPDGARGIEVQRASPVALVITDILMPEKEGLETIVVLKKEFPALKIIAMSGSGKRARSQGHLLAAQQVGADVILRKPFPPSLLLESVRALLQAPQP